MKRRRFIHRLLGVGVMVFAGMARGVNKITPRRFTWARKWQSYPGSFRAQDDILRQSKWGG